jgi:hypothetical protein
MAADPAGEVVRVGLMDEQVGDGVDRGLFNVAYLAAEGYADQRRGARSPVDGSTADGMATFTLRRLLPTTPASSPVATRRSLLVLEGAWCQARRAEQT